jgi:pimeloyl-ACP methyl ester carboxylesterase
LTVQFAPSDPTAKVTGNAIVVLSQRPFPPNGAGLLNVYTEEVRCVPDAQMKAGQEISVELGPGKQPRYAAVYFDENKNFMATGLAEPGEYHSSKVIALDGRDARIRLDRLRPPRAIDRPAWLLEHTLVSQRMLQAGFTVDQATQRFLVGLPPGYWTSQQRYPVIFVSHGFSGNRWAYLDRYKIWREEMKKRPAILVSLDSNGDYGHHLFLNSEANGPRMDVLTKEVVPLVDARYRTNLARVVYGQSSGGWTAISLLRHAPEIFAGAAATGPDPLVLRDWWMGPNENLYLNPDGTPRMFAEVIDLSMRTLVDRELETRSYGQFAAFLSCFSPSSPESSPMPFLSPFDLDSGALQAEVWKLWEDNDQSLWVRRHPELARSSFSDRLALFVGDKDEFGLYPTTVAFGQVLDEFKIPYRRRVIEGGGHTDYLDRPEFQRELYRTCLELARAR